jgi:FtsP/CotA-like multicopper oxidase with cupredoxin domain
MGRRRWALSATALVLLSLLVAVLWPAAGLGARSAAPPADAVADAAHVHTIAAAAVPAPGVTRTYYIAADEVEWDYAPSGINKITGKPFEGDALTFVQNGPDRIGHVYRKSVYREYTDATFSRLKVRSAADRHLGVLGPIIRAVVGDTIKVVFKNQTTFPASVHPHGVFYAKDSEGAPYADGTSGADKADDAVLPGQRHTYDWQVPERAGPGPMDGSSVLWMYHSHVDEPSDTNAGLIGPMIITKRGMGRADGSPIDVDRELVTMFTVFDENASHYIDHNIQAYTGNPSSVDPEDEGFHESNLMHSINGYVFGNLPDLSMVHGQRVRWYTLAQGTEVDLHTPHWHGNTVLINGMRTDVAELLPMSMKVADMVPDDPGSWLFHCHVNDHITAGMLAQYTVR